MCVVLLYYLKYVTGHMLLETSYNCVLPSQTIVVLDDNRNYSHRYSQNAITFYDIAVGKFTNNKHYNVKCPGSN